MEVRYKNKKLERVCTDHSIACQVYGKDMANKIRMRRDELEYTDSIRTLLVLQVGRCHKLKGNRKHQYAMDLVHPYRLVFSQDDEGVHIVEIQEIVDYH